MRGCRRGVQVADAFTVEVARCQNATSERERERQIATVMRRVEMLMMVLQVGATYGQSAWYEP
jgi:hypothetical protein